MGFLPLCHVVDAARYDGALCQVIEVFDIARSSHISRSSHAKRAKWNTNNGFAHVVVISKLNSNIVRKVKGMKVKVAPVKGNSLI